MYRILAAIEDLNINNPVLRNPLSPAINVGQSISKNEEFNEC